MEQLLLILSLLSSALALPGASPVDLVQSAANTTYDYVIVGCGIAGLVMTMRLSELPNVSVLCIEAGSIVSQTISNVSDLLLTSFRDHYEEIVQFPIDIGDEIGGVYDWNIGTVPQTQLDGTPRRLPMGRVVGGGSILNGMILECMALVLFLNVFQS